jgi:putative ABC transport system ATP-binding protein
MPPIVEVENVSKVYRVGEVDVPALRGVSLSVEAGEFVCIVGASGSGKSTLLHVIGGLTTPTSGRVVIEGKEYGSLSDAARTSLRKRAIGFVFQKFNLLPTLTARGNIDIAVDIAGNHRVDLEYRNRIIEMLGIGSRLHHRPSQLSGGEQQRVAIAAAAAREAPLVLADEPTAELDRRNEEIVLRALQRLRDEFGSTVVVVTHSPRVADTVDRVLEIRDGAVA